MDNRLFIRTDMNHRIATGHIMRCISIAAAAEKIGMKVIFILADAQAVDLVESYGFSSIVLGTHWNDMESELGLLLSVIEDKHISRMLIDSYQVTPYYFEVLHEKVKLAYIDGLGLQKYSLDVLICYSNYWKKLNFHKWYEKSRLVLGCGYVPLRAEFCDCPAKIVSSKINRILLMSGGTDAYHAMEKILKKIQNKDFDRIDVICGSFYEDYEGLVKKYGNLENVHFFQNVGNIKKYILNADLAISAGGSTLYELCACGTPAISYSFADNQMNNVYQFDKDKLILYAGDARWDDISERVLQLIQMYKSYTYRLEKSKEMQKLVDGMGAYRIAKVLSEL